MTTINRPAFYDRIDEALEKRSELAAAVEAIASEINPQKLPLDVKELLALLRGPALAEQFVHDDANAHWLPLILRGCPSGGAMDLDQIVADITFADEANRSRWRSVVYPLFILAIALLVFLMLAITVLPTFHKMFIEFQLKLPAATLLMMRLTTLINGSPIYFGLCLVGVGLAGFGLRKLLIWVYPYLEASSAIGRLFSGNTGSVKAMGRFTSTLAELLCVETPLDQAISIAGRASQNLRFKSASEQMAADIGPTGKFRLDSTVAHNFPMLVRRALESGPNGGPSIPLLRQITAIYLDRVRNRFDWSAGLFAPLAIVGIGLLVGFMVISLFLPLISLITSLSG